MQPTMDNGSRSNKSSEAIKRTVGVSLCMPGDKRCNATYDAITCLLDPHLHDSLNTIIDTLELLRFGT